MAFATDIRNFELNLIERISNVFATFREARERRRVYHQTVRELSALSNRELTDLGLHRSMITRVALEAAFGK